MNDEPHIGHAYTTIVGDALARWHRLLGDDVYFLTGTDEHGLKIQPRRRGRRAHAAGVRRLASPRRSPRRWKRLDIANDDFIRTTEPRHRRAVEELLQRCYDAGDIELDLYRGKYCVRCEAVLHRRRAAARRPVPDPQAAGRGVRGGELLLPPVAASSDRLLDWYAAHPGAIVPEFRGNEALGLIRSGLRDFSISRTSLDWGIPLPWDRDHVTYVWFDALTNYITAVGFGTDDERFAQWWPADYHLIGKDILRHHCVYWPAMLLSAGIELPKGWAVGGWLLVGGEKMTQDDRQRRQAARPRRHLRRRRLPLLLARRHALRADGDFSYEGVVGRYNADLANNLGNLAVARRHGGRRRSAAASDRRRRPTARSPAPPPTPSDGARGVGRGPAEPRPGGHVAARAGHQRPPGGQRAVEGRAGPGGRRRARRRPRGAADRRGPGLAGHPDDGAGDLGAHRADRRGQRPAPARRRRVGRLPGRPAGRRRAPPLFPRITA